MDKFIPSMLFVLVFSCMALTGAGATTITYDFSGGAAFMSMSGPVFAFVHYTTVGGMPLTQSFNGTASGATSWNIDGSVQVNVDAGGNVSTSPDLQATRRTGTINLAFL